MSDALPLWVDRYRDRPFRRDADGPDAYDCYGLVRAVLRDVWGLSTPALTGAWHLAMHDRLTHALSVPDCPWVPVNAYPRLGDVLTFEDPSPARELHVGISLGGRWMLHARQAEGVATARLDRLPWVALRFGPCYRHRGLLSPREDAGRRDVGKPEPLVPDAPAQADQSVSAPLRADCPSGVPTSIDGHVAAVDAAAVHPPDGAVHHEKGLRAADPPVAERNLVEGDRPVVAEEAVPDVPWHSLADRARREHENQSESLAERGHGRSVTGPVAEWIVP